MTVLQNNWSTVYEKFLHECDGNSRKALIKVFDEYPFLDFIAVLYFRAVCLKALWISEDSVKEFLLGKE